MTGAELPNITIRRMENKDSNTRGFILETINNYIWLKSSVI